MFVTNMLVLQRDILPEILVKFASQLGYFLQSGNIWEQKILVHF